MNKAERKVGRKDLAPILSHDSGPMNRIAGARREGTSRPQIRLFGQELGPQDLSLQPFGRYVHSRSLGAIYGPRVSVKVATSTPGRENLRCHISLANWVQGISGHQNTSRALARILV